MNPYAIKFTSKDLCEKPVTALLSWKNERKRDQEWSAFHRGELGYHLSLWTAERVDRLRLKKQS